MCQALRAIISFKFYNSASLIFSGKGTEAREFKENANGTTAEISTCIELNPKIISLTSMHFF